MSERTAVYRLYAPGDVLLYVGISKSFGLRWEQHAQVQPWWPEVHRQTVEWHPDRGAAHTAEVAAIEAEHPRFNVMHAGRPRRTAANKLRALSDLPPAPLTGRAAVLHSLAVEHLAAAADWEAARADLTDAIWEAADEGMKQVDIVEAVGLTRERIRQLCRPEYRAAEMKRRAER